MTRRLRKGRLICAIVAFALGSADVYGQTSKDQAAKSPWGPDDEIGTLNMMTPESRLAILSRISAGKVYDLSVDLHIGMPSCCAAYGDPRYHLWMTHTPRGSIVLNPANTSDAANARVAYSGDAISMYTHSGTHIDTLNHFGLHGKIWNQFAADEHLGDHGWTKAGAEKMPPIIARGVLIDLAKSKGMTHLPESYTITVADLRAALKQQRTTLQPGDVVLLRTGLMTLWPDETKFGRKQPGLGLEAARWLVEENKTMLIGADNFAIERLPGPEPDNWIPVHTYLLAERGVAMLEVMWLEDVAKDQVYEFALIAAPLKLRGATGSPLRPVAIPIR
jgi:kynurenine formamidase